jgi:hypothetical protein
VSGGLSGRILGACVAVLLVVGLVFALLVDTLFTHREAVALSLHSRNVLSSADEVERLVIAGQRE